MRKAITFLQSAAALYEKKIEPEKVIEISGIYPSKEVETTVNTLKTRNFDGVKSAALSIILAGYGIGVVMEKVRERACSLHTHRQGGTPIIAFPVHSSIILTTSALLPLAHLLSCSSWRPLWQTHPFPQRPRVR